ncbi:MAG: gamma-glutamylcyclotransferase family protein [Opitutaceae bacterium]
MSVLLSLMNNNYTVFVYGTLKPGGHYWPRFCEGKVSEVVPAKVHGELYDLHVGYPGAFFRGADWVQGCLLSFENEADFLQLDWLEGYEPQRSPSENEYNRLKVPCYSPKGEALGDFWAYEMTEATMTQHKGMRIESGDWPI